MAELTWIPDALRTLGGLYIALALASLACAFIKPKTAWNRGWAVAGVVVLFGALPMGSYIAGRDERQHRKEQEARQAAAKARFEMRCKSAGEKIHRTVENVDGVVWMKWREPISNADNFADQYKLNDPYGQDCGGEDCIVKLLRATEGLQLDPQKKEPHHEGYRFVESLDPRDGKPYRHTLRLYRPFDREPKWLETLIRPELVTEPIDKLTARYGVTWDDISTKEDRDYWIAGGSLKVIDLQTQEVIAERIGYMMDWGQGSQAGFRSPWGAASDNACPSKVDADGKRTQIGFTQRFVNQVLQPRETLIN